MRVRVPVPFLLIVVITVVALVVIVVPAAARVVLGGQTGPRLRLLGLQVLEEPLGAHALRLGAVGAVRGQRSRQDS